MGLHRRADRGEDVQPSGAPPRVKFTRGPDGKLRIDDQKADDRRTAIEASERPVTPDDPRGGPQRQVPPVGGA